MIEVNLNVINNERKEKGIMEKYNAPKMEIIELEHEDVIATSGCEYKNAGSFDGEWAQFNGC